MVDCCESCNVYLLGFSAALAISLAFWTTCAAGDVLEVELKRTNAGVGLAAKVAVIGRRLGSMRRRAIVANGLVVFGGEYC
jgi:hypothetical protein